MPCGEPPQSSDEVLRHAASTRPGNLLPGVSVILHPAVWESLDAEGEHGDHPPHVMVAVGRPILAWRRQPGSVRAGEVIRDGTRRDDVDRGIGLLEIDERLE